jgi:succinylglutamic semialdehyde dehydrogenase
MNRTETIFISGRWIAGQGQEFTSTDPSNGQINWRGRGASAEQIGAAVAAAKAAFADWGDTSMQRRIALLKALAEQYRRGRQEMADIICHETGKPLWEAQSEVDSMAAKVDISIEAYDQRCAEHRREMGGASGVTRFRPHGVLAVFGPFNMPGHLPNGHIVPALLPGNTVVFKPSEQAPLVGQRMAEMIGASGFPPGVVNLVQGGRDVGAQLAGDANLSGILFTGSTTGGRAINRMLADHPEKILALEMGGNNPLIVHEVEDLSAAACMVIQSAYVSAGQRCSCARRLIVCRGGPGDQLIQRLATMIGKLRLGFWNDQPPPFMGTVISSAAADQILEAQKLMRRKGARSIVELKRDPRSNALLSPGLIDVTDVPDRPDVEIFGPLLQVIRVDDFAAAIAEANRTAFGLSAGLISDRAENYEQFVRRIRAGVVHWNRPLTGASSQLPFGGIGISGNHRPGGFLAADYAAYPLACLESPRAQMPAQLPPGIVP